MRERVEFAVFRPHCIREHRGIRRETRLGDGARHTVDFASVAAKFCTLVLAHALACETQTDARAAIVWNRHERKHLACDRFLCEAVLLVDSAESVIHQEDTRAIVTLPEIRDPAEIDGYRHPESFRPSL